MFCCRAINTSRAKNDSRSDLPWIDTLAPGRSTNRPSNTDTHTNVPVRRDLSLLALGPLPFTLCPLPFSHYRSILNFAGGAFTAHPTFGPGQDLPKALEPSHPLTLTRSQGPILNDCPLSCILHFRRFLSSNIRRELIFPKS
jgi:hypothetical protein